MKQFLSGGVFLLLLASFPSCKRDLPDHDNYKQKKVQVAVDRVRKNLSDTVEFPIPSISILIQTPAGKIFVTSVAPSAQLVTAETHFRFASNTKNFTAAAILNMWEDGWLDYKAKITDVIPGSKDITYVPATPEWSIPYKDDITIEQLLQNAAGVFDIDNEPITEYGGLTYIDYVKKSDPDHQFSPTELVKFVSDRGLSYFPPGIDYHYSNTGFSMLSEIIKRVYSFRAGAPKTYQDYLEDYIVNAYAPIPLPSLHFPILATDNTMPHPRISGMVLYPNETIIYDSYNMSPHVGQGNGYGTMEDVNRYIRTLMKGDNVLKSATIQLMQKSVSIGNKDYGLGCFFTPNLGYGHNGGLAGYFSLMKYDPEHDVSVVALLPFWDMRDGFESALKCLNAMYDAAYGARQALGYPGKP